MKRANSRMVLIALAVLAACGPDPRQGLEAVAEPDLSGVSQQARDLYHEEQGRLTALLGRKDPDPAALAGTFGRLGELAQAGERVDIAGACYRNAQRLTPEDYRWPYYLGQLEKFSGKWDESIRHFQRARELRPDYPPTLTHLAQLYLDRDDLERAAALYREAVALGDPSSAAQFGLGLVSVARGDYADAAGHFEVTLARAPAADRVHYHLGLVYGRLGQRDRAAEHMALQGPGLPRPADPLMDEVEALRELIKQKLIPGATAVSEGREGDALEDLRAAQAADPEDALTRLGLGTLLARQGSLQEAEQHLRAALRLSTDRLVTQNAGLNLGNLLVETGRTEEALAQYRSTIDLDPDVGYARDARLQLVQSLVKLGRADEAEADIQNLLEQDPRAADFYLAVGDALSRKGRYGTARQVYERGRRAHTQDARIANALARLLATCPDATVRDGTVALQLASSLFNASRSGPFAVTLAMALAENGRFAEATDLQRRSIAEAERLGRVEMLEELRADLRLYETAKPVRR